MNPRRENKGRAENWIILWNVRKSSLHNCYIYLMNLIAEQKSTMLIILEAPKVDNGIDNTMMKSGFEGFKLVEGV